jgi:hypothetical protein
MHLLNTLPQRLDPGATPTFAGLIASNLTAPAATNLTLAGGTAGSDSVVVSNTLAASSSIIGAFKVGNGTAATNVAIGGGNINAGGTGTFGGRIGINGAAANFAGANVSGIMPNIGGDSNGVGYFSNGTFPASFTAGAHSFYSLPATTASAYTVTNMSGFYAAAPTKGAGSTITNLYGVYVEALTQGTNNYAFRSVGGGIVSIADSTAGSAGAGALVVTGGLSAGNNGNASYFGGALTVAGATVGTSTFDYSVNSNSVQAYTIQNNSTGANAATRFSIVAGSSSCSIQLFGSGNTTPNIMQYSSPSSHKFFCNGVSRLDFDVLGNLTTGGSISAAAATFTGAVTVNAISGINALAGGTQLATFESSVNGALAELITKGKNSTGTARQANMGINRFADDVWSLSNGTTEHLRVSLTTGAATFAGTVIAPAATASLAPLRIPHGTAPTSPTNGDMWTTTAGLYIRINGATVGPLS